MGVRTTLSEVSRRSQMMLHRSTPRAINGKKLCPEGKQCDGFHSHTDSDVEVAFGWGSVGIPLDQAKDQEKQTTKPALKGEQGEWNHDQPQGKSAEMVMMRLGSFSHPVAMPLADRRVQPMIKPGESAHYATSGTGQMLFHNNAGSYLVAVNNPPEQSEDSKETERFASLRHASKAKEKRDLRDDEDSPDHKHEGETINTEVRCSSGRIEFRVGDEVVGYYDKAAKRWTFIGEIKLGSEDALHPVYGVVGSLGKITVRGGPGAVLVNATLPGPPTSLDAQP